MPVGYTHTCSGGSVGLKQKWRSCPDKTVTYETVRDMMVLVSRLTGYGMDDIEEYLINSFEDAVWDFGYAVFLLG